MVMEVVQVHRPDFTTRRLTDGLMAICSSHEFWAQYLSAGLLGAGRGE